MVYSRKSRYSVRQTLKKKTKKAIKLNKKALPRFELDFFRELGYFFINENRYYLMIFIVITPIVLVITYHYLNLFFGICFLLGYLEFYATFWLTRRMFIKSMIRLKLKNDTLELK